MGEEDEGAVSGHGEDWAGGTLGRGGGAGAAGLRGVGKGEGSRGSGDWKDAREGE